MSHPSTATLPPPHVAHHFADLEQQREAGTLAMWVFLGSEILFFGGLFTAYAVMRSLNPLGFGLGAAHLSALLGGVNTAVLLTSSFTMALSVWAAQTARRSELLVFLTLTLLLGASFLGIKMYEWHDEYVHHLVPGEHFVVGNDHEGEPISADVGRGMQMFFVFYFTITGLHALHMIIGLGVLLVQLLLALRGTFGIRDYQPIELSGLYWHFVDIVWIFVFPLIYLLRH